MKLSDISSKVCLRISIISGIGAIAGIAILAGAVSSLVSYNLEINKKYSEPSFQHTIEQYESDKGLEKELEEMYKSNIKDLVYRLSEEQNRFMKYKHTKLIEV